MKQLTLEFPVDRKKPVKPVKPEMRDLRDRDEAVLRKWSYRQK